MKPLRIALLCLRGATNMASWQGNAASIVRELEALGHSVTRVDFSDELHPIFYKSKQLFLRHVMGQMYSRHREPAMLRFYGRELGQRLRAMEIDVVLSLTGMPLPYLDIDVPIVLWNDAPFDALVNFYPGFSRLSRASLRDGHQMERLAHERAARAVYSSAWGAHVASGYGYPDRLRIVSFGANVSVAADEHSLIAAAERRTLQPLNLAWIGMEWERKGGDVALDIVALLHASGIPTRLRLAGARPPGKAPLPRGVEFVGFVQGREKEALLADSDFLVLPSRADCSPIVFAEAAACATPSLASHVGGIPAMIQNGVNGQTFAVDDAGAYAKYLARISQDLPAYRGLCRGALGVYRSELNWKSATASIVNVIEEVISADAATGTEHAVAANF